MLCYSYTGTMRLSDYVQSLLHFVMPLYSLLIRFTGDAKFINYLYMCIVACSSTVPITNAYKVLHIQCLPCMLNLFKLPSIHSEKSYKNANAETASMDLKSALKKAGAHKHPRAQRSVKLPLGCMLTVREFNITLFGTPLKLLKLHQPH